MMNSITTRLIILLTICAALIVGGGMFVDYRLSREEILQRLVSQSRDEVQVVMNDLENWLSSVEATPRFLATVLAQRNYSNEGLRQMLHDIVQHNSAIYGAAIALNPEDADGQPGFAPYYFRRDGAIHYANLAGPQASYQTQPWYTQPIKAGTAIWVEPYFDTGGGEVHMTTFSVPVFRYEDSGQRSLYAIVTADVTLSSLQQALGQLHLGESSYTLLFSKAGLLMSTRTQKTVMKHYSQLNRQGLDLAPWPEMLQRARAGEVITRDIPCPEADSQCTIRLGRLHSTGWPIAVVYDQREILAPLHKYQLKTGLISAISLLLMGLAVYIVTSRQTRPLKDLTRATEDLARGVMDSPLPTARGDDEIARLVRSFSSMNRSLKTYIADLESATASRSRLEGELNAAREIQMSMLPGAGEALVLEDGVELWARVQPAKTVGGDLYTFYRGGNQLFLAVGDVSDKGVPAALFMARAISLIQQLSGTATPPDEAMAKLNNALERDNNNCMFVTLFLGVLDIPSGQLRFASAGHTAPSLLRNGGVTVINQETGPALGLVADQHYPENTLELHPEDRLAIYTDGIDEAFNENGQMYGVDQFNQALLNYRQMSVADAGEALFTAVEQHAGKQPQSDDITVLLLQYAARTLAAHHSFRLDAGITGRVHAWLESEMGKWAIPAEMVLETGLIAEEIVSNIHKYAGLSPADELSLTLTSSGATLALEARDTGKAFDPLRDGRRAELGAEIASAKIGGLGVHLITRLSDRQHYRREEGCNVLRIEKDLPTGAS